MSQAMKLYSQAQATAA